VVAGEKATLLKLHTSLFLYANSFFWDVLKTLQLTCAHQFQTKNFGD